MANEIDDNGLDLGEASFDDFEKKKGTLGTLWRDSTAVKIGIIVAATAAIFGTIIVFGGTKTPLFPSAVPEGSEISAPPGTEHATPAYVEAIQEENEARTEQAIEQGTSSLPTPVDPPVGRLTTTEDEKTAEDPLQRWRKLQEERLQREVLSSHVVRPEITQEEATAKTEAVQALSEAMAAQMQSVLEKHNTPKQVQYRAMTPPSWLEEMKKEEEKEQAAAEQKANGTETEVEVIIVPAGQVYYAQILTEANSDIPGPVLAQIVSGPLAGNRILGSFAKQEELLTLNFDTVVIDGVSQSIDGIALDPETTLPAMATDVDHHYLKRIVLPVAASFIEGMASAVAESDETTVVTDSAAVTNSVDKTAEQELAAGVGEAGEKLSEIIDEIAGDTEVTVIIERGTPFGILFLQPVLENDDAI